MRSAYGACSTRRCMARCQARRAYGAEINYRLRARRWHTQVRRGEQQHSLSFKVLNVWKACRKPTTANPCFEDI